MELSLLNILFFINAVVVGFSRKEIKIPVSSIFAVVSLLCYGIYLGFYQTGINTQVWPVLIFSQMYFLQEVLLSRRNKGAAPELALVCGIAPLLLISTNNLLSFFLFLSLIEFFKYLFWWNEKAEKLSWLKRMQFIDAIKFLVMIIALYVILIIQGNFEIGDQGLRDPGAIILSALLLVLAFLYFGIFEGTKDARRNIEVGRNKNPLLFTSFHRVLIPGVIILKLGKLSQSLDYILYEKVLIGLVLLSFCIVMANSFNLKSRQDKSMAFFRFGFILLSALYLFDEKFLGWQYLSILIGVGAISLFLDIGKFANQKLFTSVAHIILPSPFSPFYWWIVFMGFSYIGPSSDLLKGFIIVVYGIGIISFNRFPYQLVGSDQRLGLSKLVGLALLAPFVTILFVVKMSI